MKPHRAILIALGMFAAGAAGFGLYRVGIDQGGVDDVVEADHAHVIRH